MTSEEKAYVLALSKQKEPRKDIVRNFIINDGVPKKRRNLGSSNKMALATKSGILRKSCIRIYTARKLRDRYKAPVFVRRVQQLIKSRPI